MKATEQYFPVVLFVMLYKVVLTFQSVDEILKCNHSNESYWAVLSCGAVCYAVQGGSTFRVCNESQSLTIIVKATEQYFPAVYKMRSTQIKTIKRYKKIVQYSW